MSAKFAASAYCSESSSSKINPHESHLPRKKRSHKKFARPLCKKNVFTYPSQGRVDGLRGDHILLAPPFILTPSEAQLISTALEFALQQVFPRR